MNYIATTFFTFFIVLSCGNSKNMADKSKQNINSPNETYTINLVDDLENDIDNLTITFNNETKTLTGFTGCNNFSGSYEINNNAIKISSLATTRKLCQDTENLMESKIIQALNDSNSFILVADNLTLKNDNATVMTLKKEASEMIITYEATTRGFFEKIWISEASTSFSNDRSLSEKTSKETPKSDWDELTSLLKAIDVNSLANLEPPSKTFQHDAAAMAKLIVTRHGTTYESTIFDHGNPPKSIENIVNKILSMKKMVEKK